MKRTTKTTRPRIDKKAIEAAAANKTFATKKTAKPAAKKSDAPKNHDLTAKTPAKAGLEKGQAVEVILGLDGEVLKGSTVCEPDEADKKAIESTKAKAATKTTGEKTPRVKEDLAALLTAEDKKIIGAMSKSEAARYLLPKGFKVSSIARYLGTYASVVTGAQNRTPKAPTADVTVDKDTLKAIKNLSKADAAYVLFEKGVPPRQVASLLHTHVSYVHALKSKAGAKKCSKALKAQEPKPIKRVK